MTCKHTLEKGGYVLTEHPVSGELTQEWEVAEIYTLEDLGIGAFKCTQCHEVQYYTGSWKKFYEEGVPCSGSSSIRASEIERVKAALALMAAHRAEQEGRGAGVPADVSKAHKPAQASTASASQASASTDRAIALAAQFPLIAELLEEASEVLSRIPDDVASSLGLRTPLADELHGTALMLREAGAVPVRDAAQSD